MAGLGVRFGNKYVKLGVFFLSPFRLVIRPGFCFTFRLICGLFLMVLTAFIFTHFDFYLVGV